LREIRLEEGRIRAVSLLGGGIPSGEHETDDVARAELGGQPVTGEGRERWQNEVEGRMH
jgi:hypothetical protein